VRPIICAYDGSAPARRGAEAAGWLAERTGAPLELASVVDEGQLPALPREGAAADPALRDKLYTMQEARARLAARRELERAAAGLGGAATYAVHDGRPAAVLAALAAERDAMLLVSGTSARAGLDHVLQGGLPGRLAAEAPCPIVTVAAGAAVGDDGPVLAGDDGSAHAHRALRHAAALAERLGRELVTLTVEGAEPAAAIAEAASAQRACLIVVGTRGRGPLRAALFGSVSGGLVRDAGRPVALVAERAGHPA
jgi:nucleotide-binding universal stress UspA family protein